MSTYLLGLRPFGLKCVSICYINYSRKLPKIFISPTLCWTASLKKIQQIADKNCLCTHNESWKNMNQKLLSHKHNESWKKWTKSLYLTRNKGNSIFVKPWFCPQFKLFQAFWFSNNKEKFLVEQPHWKYWTTNPKETMAILLKNNYNKNHCTNHVMILSLVKIISRWSLIYLDNIKYIVV